MKTFEQYATENDLWWKGEIFQAAQSAWNAAIESQEPDGWITSGSLRCLRRGGSSKGTVPVHKNANPEANARWIPVYTPEWSKPK